MALQFSVNPKPSTGLLTPKTPTNQTSTPKAAVRAPATPTQIAYGDTPPVIGYTNNPVSLGSQARSPDQNLVQPSNTLPSGQTAVTKPAVNSNTSSNSTGGTSWPNPTATPVVPTTGTNAGTTNTSNNGLYSQLINKLSTVATDPNSQVNTLADQLAANQTKAATVENGEYNRAAPLFYNAGRSQIDANQFNQQQTALSNRLTAAQANQGQQVTALSNAANLTSPIQVPYSNQVINPVTGQPVSGGGAGTLPADAQTAVASYAQQVQNGSMTRADAESRLSAYGVAGINALNAALGSNFNTNASNASAATTATGQQLQTAANATNQALGTLQTLYNSLPTISSTGLPILNNIGNSIENSLGSSALTTYKQTLADARAQLQGVLTASGAATPTGAESAALTYLPDNMTPAQLKTAIANVQQLIQQKVNSFTQSGTQGGTPANTSSTGTSAGWF